MIKKLILTGLFFIGWIIGFTQTRQAIDSLEQRLARANNDTSRINALVALCLLHRLGNTDTAMMYGQEALESAERIGYLQGQIPVLGFMCIAAGQQGNLAKSLELGFKALRLAEEHHLEHLSGPASDGIGEVYIILRDYHKAISYLRRFILLRGAGEGLAYVYFDLGVAHAGLNQLDSANFYEEKAIETFHSYGYEEPLVYQVLGDIRIKSGQPAEAMNYYQKSLRISIEKNERRASVYAYSKIAGFYKSSNQNDSAIYYAGKSLEESKLIKQKNPLLEAAALLSELYEPTNTKESLRYLKIADAYKDSLFGTGNTQAVQALIAREEERQKEIKDARVAYQNQLEQYALIAGVIVLLLIAFVLYRNNRKEKKAKDLLHDKNQLIEQTLNNLKSTQAQLIQSEKMASLGELTAGIAHEIQNPLNFVNNFSEVNKEMLVEMKEELDKGNINDAKAIANNLIDNEEKINHHGKRADAIVKGMLQHSRAGSGQKEPTDINALADEYLRLAYHGLRAKDKSISATIETNFDKSIGKINIMPQDIGRVLVNLITNAFYAVSAKASDLGKTLADELATADSRYEPTVSVSTKKMGHKALISVRDNGPGIPQTLLDKIFQPFFTTKPAGQGTGLGLSLAYDIVKAHGGEIKVETKEGGGAAFTIELPILQNN